MVGIALGGLLANVSCSEEEEVPPPEDQPEKENTVELVAADAWDPACSPDDRKIVFVEAYHLTVYDLVSDAKTVITPDAPSMDYCPRKPAWLPGDVIAFIQKDETTDECNIWTVPATGGTITKHDAVADPDSSLGADETGQYVFFTIVTDRLIYRLDLNTDTIVNCSREHPIGFAHYDPVKKPGENKVYYIEREIPFNSIPHGEYIYEVIASGGGYPRVVRDTSKPFLEGLTLSTDDKYLVSAHRDGLFAYEYRTGNDTWLTRSSDVWTDKDRNPHYTYDGADIVFERAESIYSCEAP
jgi:Tol biopolymer transport system component